MNTGTSGRPLGVGSYSWQALPSEAGDQYALFNESSQASRQNISGGARAALKFSPSFYSPRRISHDPDARDIAVSGELPPAALIAFIFAIDPMQTNNFPQAGQSVSLLA
ncbi:hypothetical protein [Herbaspirillum rhizosphaerae]|uniref:hypothetical protein n=1 Tax=Herbaspirillum rhizosphaerae TaxID=346179 RepID=UPI0012EE4D30|nr:hypothetical protein [Herbaspirillum rhizosphaerae]